MNFLILRATGRTGKLIVAKLLEKGQGVHALVRDKNKIETGHPGLKIFEGSPKNPGDVRTAIKDCQAAISGLNLSRKSDSPWSPLVSPPDLMSSSVRNMIMCMKEEGIRRAIVITAAGAGDSWNQMPWWFKGFIKSSNIGITYKDHHAQEKLLEESGLDWTLVRPVGLNDKMDDQNIKISLDGDPPGSSMISRNAVASFIVRELTENKYLRKKPIQSGKKK